MLAKSSTSWIQTYSGKKFDPLDPDPDQINIIDIAHGLGNMCRYSGQCLKFYSVAEHSVLLATKAPKHLKRSALMHDASEAYFVDVPRPIKGYLTNYYEIEERLMRAICIKFDLSYPLPAEVKRMDNAILGDELDQNMAPPPEPWSQITEPRLNVKLKFWSPEEATAGFLMAYNTLFGVK